MRTPCLALSVLSGVLLVPVVADAGEPYSQWSTPASSGVGQGATKLDLGVEWAHLPSDYSLRIAGEFEHLLRDRIGLVGHAAVPLAGEWVAPASLGLRVHLLPLYALDPYLGGGGGVAWMKPQGLAARIDPLVSAEAGFAFYYFGLFYIDANARYDLVRYAAPKGAMDASGPVLSGRLGVYF